MKLKYLGPHQIAKVKTNNTYYVKKVSVFSRSFKQVNALNHIPIRMDARDDERSYFYKYKYNVLK